MPLIWVQRRRTRRCRCRGRAPDHGAGRRRGFRVHDLRARCQASTDDRNRW